MNDQEWIDIKVAASKVNGTFVNKIEESTLCLTGYSPSTQQVHQ